MFLSKKLLLTPAYSGVVAWNDTTTTNLPYYARNVGTTWGQGDVSFDNVNECVYGNGIYVAVGQSQKLLSSTNGLTWIARTCPAGVTHLRSVTWDSTRNKFFALGTGGTTYNIISSTNGVDWTFVSTLTGFYPQRIVCGNGVIVGLSYQLKVIGSSTVPTYCAVKSTDGGSTWTSAIGSVAAPTYTIRNLCYGNGHFVAMGRYNSNDMSNGWMSSTDGLNWTITRVPGTDSTSNSNHTIYLNTNGSIFLSNSASYNSATATYTRHLYSSTDGITWTDNNISGTVVEQIPATYCIAYAHGIFSFNTQGYSVTTKTGINNFTLYQTNVGSIGRVIN